MAQLNEIVKPRRWLRTLGGAARLSAPLALAIVRVLETWLETCPPTADQAAVLELLVELSAEIQRKPACVTFLNSFTGKSRAARLAHTALGMTGDGAQVEAQAAAQIRASRLDRAQRWSVT